MNEIVAVAEAKAIFGAQRRGQDHGFHDGVVLEAYIDYRGVFDDFRYDNGGRGSVVGENVYAVAVDGVGEI